MRPLVHAFVRLRWRLLRGAIRHGGAEQVGAVASLLASAMVGIGVGAAVLVGGRTSEHSADLSVIFCTVVVIAVMGFGVVAGIAQPIDPRVLAPEPLTARERGVGLLAASAFGPPGLAGMLIAIGLAVGMTPTLAALPITLAAALSWLLSLLLVARTATNLLALAPQQVPAARSDHGRVVRSALLRRHPIRPRAHGSARPRGPGRGSELVLDHTTRADRPGAR